MKIKDNWEDIEKIFIDEGYEVIISTVHIKDKLIDVMNIYYKKILFGQLYKDEQPYITTVLRINEDYEIMKEYGLQASLEAIYEEYNYFVDKLIEILF